jgi:hypothetical protein
MSKKNIESEIYDIDDYTDEELYEILDLLNPSDRELEAKILFFIRKYEDIGNLSSKKIVDFFEAVYSRFFDPEDEVESKIEGFENINTKYADVENANYVSNTFKPNNNGEQRSTENEVSTKNASANPPVIFTQSLDYSKDPLNPLLKQTTARIMSIDSQYRTDKMSLSTDFAFDLSEPLKDVVSMKLYSFQIPYTWYTIGKSFGCNFFGWDASCADRGMIGGRILSDLILRLPLSMS